MATKTKRTSLVREEVEKLSGKVQGKRFTVVLDDINHSDEWDPAILPIMQADELGKVNIVDGVSEFVFRDRCSSTIQFIAIGGKLMVAKFFALQPVEVSEDDGATESV